LKAIQEWGQSISQITHLILCTTSCFGSVPGPDTHLARLLNLKPTVNRLIVFGHGCHAGGTILRIAKDMAENNVGSRVLAVCSETMLASFQTPTDNFAPATDVLIGHALFADGAAAMIIGADPNPTIERPLFEIVSASQTTVPDTQNSIRAQIPVENGRLVYHFVKEIPNIVSNNVKKCVTDALCSIGFDEDIEWNKLFYVVHPGGPLVLSKVEEKLGLSEGKLKESWNVLREYGNMWSSTVIFILNEMRKRAKIEGKGTTGEGLEWGVFLGFGPGVVIETVLLRSVACVEK
jgi:chalcone synthase